jgi:hypothetical protein
MFVIVELLYGTWGRKKGKENDKESIISKYITFVQVEDITILLKAVKKWEVEEKG